MIFRHSIQGMRCSIIAIISSVMELLVRGITGYLSVKYVGFHGIAVAWILTVIYFIHRKR